MKLDISFFNPITSKKDVLSLKYPNVDYNYWKNNSYYFDNDLQYILDFILSNLDCSREYSYGRPMSMDNLNYEYYLSNYYYYIIKFNNKSYYDIYIDKLIKLHINNIIFEYEYTNRRIIENKPKKSKKRPPNKFVRYITHDLFTNEKVYIYENLATKETIESSNPNLLDELNSKKKTKRQTKIVSSVSLNDMTFNFKIK